VIGGANGLVVGAFLGVLALAAATTDSSTGYLVLAIVLWLLAVAAALSPLMQRFTVSDDGLLIRGCTRGSGCPGAR
jgi:hypothetical protein